MQKTEGDSLNDSMPFNQPKMALNQSQAQLRHKYLQQKQISQQAEDIPQQRPLLKSLLDIFIEGFQVGQDRQSVKLNFKQLQQEQEMDTPDLQQSQIDQNTKRDFEDNINMSKIKFQENQLNSQRKFEEKLLISNRDNQIEDFQANQNLKFNENTPLQQNLIYCKEHPIKKVKYLCKVDQKLFCSKCLFQHFDHADQVYEFGQDEIMEQLKQLQQEIQKKKTSIDENFNILNEILQNEKSIDSETLWNVAQQAKMIISESLNQYKGQFESLIEVNNLQQNQIEELINENININQVKDQLSEQLNTQISKNEQMKSQILSMTEQLYQLEFQIENQKKIEKQISEIDVNALIQNGLYPSLLVQSLPRFELLQQIKYYLCENVELLLLYRGSQDGFSAAVFHQKCDDQGDTLTVAKSQFNKIFGGYTDIPWQSPFSGCSKSGNGKSFLFSVQENGQVIQLKCKNKKKETYHRSDVMSWFGIADLSFSDDCFEKPNGGYSNIGNSYYAPDGIKYDTYESKSYLAGARNFKVEEIEVYKVIKSENIFDD